MENQLPQKLGHVSDETDRSASLHQLYLPTNLNATTDLHLVMFWCQTMALRLHDVKTTEVAGGRPGELIAGWWPRYQTRAPRSALFWPNVGTSQARCVARCRLPMPRGLDRLHGFRPRTTTGSDSLSPTLRDTIPSEVLNPKEFLEPFWPALRSVIHREHNNLRHLYRVRNDERCVWDN